MDSRREVPRNEAGLGAVLSLVAHKPAGQLT